jgi:hypothetical protein
MTSGLQLNLVTSLRDFLIQQSRCRRTISNLPINESDLPSRFLNGAKKCYTYYLNPNRVSQLNLIFLAKSTLGKKRAGEPNQGAYL